MSTTGLHLVHGGLTQSLGCPEAADLDKPGLTFMLPDKMEDRIKTLVGELEYSIEVYDHRIGCLKRSIESDPNHFLIEHRRELLKYLETSRTEATTWLLRLNHLFDDILNNGD